MNTFESIKLELLRLRKTIGIPAVYAIQTNLTFPIEETLLPVAKRILVRHLAVEEGKISG